jgi:pimeloyl-ACP methyl ester carboxylesterase
MVGRLTTPKDSKPLAVVVYVQNAESSTADELTKTLKGEVVRFFDLYGDNLAGMQTAFFSYEGRGVRSGSTPPQFRTIDWEAFNTSSLENKVRDALSAVAAVRRQPGLEKVKLFLVGSSEGSLLAAEAASRDPGAIDGVALLGVLALPLRDNLKFQLGDGPFLVYRHYLDTDHDGKISKEEFESDRNGFLRKYGVKNNFGDFDTNKDGVFTADDIRLRMKKYVEATEKNDIRELSQWADASSRIADSRAVAMPKGWVADHFSHDRISKYLLKLDMPVGVFHGTLDGSCPVEAVRELEEELKKGGKKNIVFGYVKDADHSLDAGDYWEAGKLPEGYQKLFGFVRDHTKARE